MYRDILLTISTLYSNTTCIQIFQHQLFDRPNKKTFHTYNTGNITKRRSRNFDQLPKSRLSIVTF